MTDGSLLIEKLITYAKEFLYLNDSDVTYTRNFLLYALKIEKPYGGAEDLSCIKKLEVPDVLAEELKNYISENKIAGKDDAEIFINGIFGSLTQKPSEINSFFLTLKEANSTEKALRFLYDLSIKNNYIQKSAIDKNIKWDCLADNNKIEITINLSKPEKDNKDIAKLLYKKDVEKYPRCLLCAENEGYSGRADHPSRQNLRVINFKLDGADWFLQFSPYQYYNEHCIVINKQHIPMVVNESTFKKLIEFVDLFPNYFIGSNASLPIVGGSILNHEHYQGGGYEMPMFSAGVLKEFKKENFKNTEISVLDWFNSCVKLKGRDKDELLQLCNLIYNSWNSYDDESCEIISKTDDVRHNAITPIVRKAGEAYEAYLILRNNRTNERHKGGIFHAHEQYHNIKKEGIGLIEAMGLFILPGRLDRQMRVIEEILTGKTDYNPAGIQKEDNDLYVHGAMIEELAGANGTHNKEDKAQKLIRDYINNVCKNILINTAVFKLNTDAGRTAMEKYLAGIGIY